MWRDIRLDMYIRQANMHYDSYFMHCSAIAREAESLLSENNIEYETVNCSMFRKKGLCITIGLIEGLLIPYVIPVEVFFNNVKTQEDIKIYAI